MGFEMLVNHRLKMVFMHAPKCAGITVSHWLTEHYGFRNHTNPDDFCPGTETHERHRRLLPEDCNGCQIITCFRDLFDRWESYFLYCTLKLGVNMPFDEFTRERLTWLPLQVEYTRHAEYILRVEHLKSDVLTLPFVEDPAPPLPRMNVSQFRPGYEQAKQRVQWTDEIREMVQQRFEPDFNYL